MPEKRAAFIGVKLRKQGLSRNDVNVVGADPSELAPLLAKGDLDAACFWEPWGRKTVALAPTKLHVIGTGRDIYAVNMYLTVRRSYAKQQPESVKAILAGLQEANAYIGANKSEAIEIFRKKHRLDAEMANALVNEWEYSLVLDQQAISAMREVGKWLVENKKLGALLDWNAGARCLCHTHRLRILGARFHDLPGARLPRMVAARVAAARHGACGSGIRPPPG